MLKTNTYGYVRASTLDQQDTLKVQEDKIRGYCTFKELGEPIIYVDSGVSGSTEMKKRPEGGKLYDSLRTGDTLIVNKLDRISRNVLDFVGSINYFNKNGIKFHCLEPNIDITSSFGLFMCHILSSVAELERNMTIDRTKATIQKRKEEGLCIGSVPYGFSKLENKKLVENKIEQDNIKRIKMYHKDGLNFKAIADKMNDLDIPNRSGKWYCQQIKRIIK